MALIPTNIFERLFKSRYQDERLIGSVSNPHNTARIVLYYFVLCIRHMRFK